MKLLCYGASVTAQKEGVGYFSYLPKSRLSTVFSSFERVAFGASHYDYAGYGLMQDALEKRPDVCIIDWLTPSMKSFSPIKISTLNRALIAKNCLPVWIYFPRTDNFETKPACYNQVKEAAEQFNIPFIDCLDETPEIKNNPSYFLRDVVHTTEAGAKQYAHIIEKHLMEMDFTHRLSIARCSDAYLTNTPLNLPTITSFGCIINDTNCIEATFEWDGGIFDLLLDSVVGPHVCKFDIEIHDCGQSQAIIKQVNPADPWCHYERSMIIPALSIHLAKGSYRIKLKKSNDDPFSNITLNKPAPRIFTSSERYLSISRFSANTSLRLIAISCNLS